PKPMEEVAEDEEDENYEGYDFLKPETSEELKTKREGFLRSVHESLWSLSAKFAKSVQGFDKALVEEYRVVLPSLRFLLMLPITVEVTRLLFLFLKCQNMGLVQAATDIVGSIRIFLNFTFPSLLLNGI